ncbi:flavin reductase family protein [Streptomyces sp. NPDC096046]|uniref:flavin reductase family protein n=1 Tax=Streptomyces TaxID=1883 RepID=UPI00332CCE0E
MSALAAVPPSDVGTADPTRLRRALGAFATGVTVVTVGGSFPHGMTANSFTSVSLDPPLILVCLGRDTIMHRVLADAETFSVSVLDAGQEQVARYFADRSRPTGTAQFETVRCRPGRSADAPLITGAAAHFECAKWRAYDGGDHIICVGEVLALHDTPDREPLVFHRGRFRRFTTARSDGAA